MGHPWATTVGSTCSLHLTPLLNRGLPMNSHQLALPIKGQLLLSLLFPLPWNLPEKCPQTSWCQPLPGLSHRPLSLWCSWLLQPETSIGSVPHPTAPPWPTSRAILPELNPCPASAFHGATGRSLSNQSPGFLFSTSFGPAGGFRVPTQAI